jgi:hypothetical protein
LYVPPKLDRQSSIKIIPYHLFHKSKKEENNEFQTYPSDILFTKEVNLQLDYILKFAMCCKAELY